MHQTNTVLGIGESVVHKKKKHPNPIVVEEENAAK